MLSDKSLNGNSHSAALSKKHPTRVADGEPEIASTFREQIGRVLFHFPSACGPGNASIQEQNEIMRVEESMRREVRANGDWPLPADWPPEKLLVETAANFPETFRELVADLVRDVLEKELPEAIRAVMAKEAGK